MTSGSTDARPIAWELVESEALPRNVPALLDDAASRHPERSFWNSIEGDGVSFTYSEFAHLTRVCALHLRDAGVRKGTHVGLLLPNAAGFLITWMALCRLGAVAVMINTSSTSAELARMLRDADIGFLVIDAQYLQVYEGVPIESHLPAKRLVVHGHTAGYSLPSGAVSFQVLLKGASDTNDAEVSLDDIASIQFTSGSSGVPKACMLSHRYWLTLGKARSCLGPVPERMLIDSPMFYMGPLWRILMAIYCGAMIFVAPRYSLSRLFDRIIDHRIDFCSVTYPVAKLDPDPRLTHTSLKFLTTYGLAKELHAALEERFGVPVREIYGMTEVGSVLSMPVADASMVGSGSCGVPVPFRRCRIVAEGKDVPAGASGELWVAGPGMFSGYFGNEEATAAAFEGEWFKTGDLFMRDDNGYYYMLGRIKDVIRRSGENISAAEIELTVNAINGVLEVAAIPAPNPLRGEEVKVVVSRAPGESGARLTAEAIVQACQAALAPFKVPRYVQFLDTLPKTPAGKIDKAPLKAAAVSGDGDVYDARPDKRRGA